MLGSTLPRWTCGPLHGSLDANLVRSIFQILFPADLEVTDTSQHFVRKINPLNYSKILKLHKCSMAIANLGNEATFRKNKTK